MDLLNRYLQAVKFWLPRAQQDDIIAELRDDIRSEIEERESALGRSLHDSELEDLLKQRGRPLLVAEKYLPQRSLIGPALFPAYWFVLKLVMLCYLFPWALVLIGSIVFHTNDYVHRIAPTTLTTLWTNAVGAFATVTIIFAVLDRAKNKNWLTQNWSPSKLPPVRDSERIPRAGSAIEVIMGLIFGTWWLKAVWNLTILDSHSLKISLAPAWHAFFWAFLPWIVVSVALSAFNFVRPYWTRARHGVKAALCFAGAIILTYVAKIQPMSIVTYPSAGPEKQIVAAINLGLSSVFAIAVVINVVIGCIELWRIHTMNRKRTQFPSSVVA
jgi:hypothetical protein